MPGPANTTWARLLCVRPERIVDGALRKVGPVVFRCSFDRLCAASRAQRVDRTGSSLTVGKARLVGTPLAMGKCTTGAAGVGVQARREGFTEITSGRSYSQQGSPTGTTTCKDQSSRENHRQQEGLGLAHEPVVAMREGACGLVSALWAG